MEFKSPPSARQLRASRRASGISGISASGEEDQVLADESHLETPPHKKPRVDAAASSGKEEKKESKSSVAAIDLGDDGDDEDKNRDGSVFGSDLASVGSSPLPAALVSPSRARGSGSKNLFSALLSRQFGSPLSPQQLRSVATPHRAHALSYKLAAHTKLFEDRDRVQNFALHASQPLAVVGTKNGAVAAWRFPGRASDSEYEVLPASVLHEQEGSRVNEVRFHPRSEQLVFSGSYGGELWQHDLRLARAHTCNRCC